MGCFVHEADCVHVRLVRIDTQALIIRVVDPDPVRKDRTGIVK